MIAKAAIKEHHKFLGQFLAGPVPCRSMGTGDSADVVPENRVSPWAVDLVKAGGVTCTLPHISRTSTGLPTYLPTHLPTYIFTYIPGQSRRGGFRTLQHILRTNAASRTALEQQHFSPPTYWIDLSFKIILDIFDSSRTQVWRLDESCTSSRN